MFSVYDVVFEKANFRQAFRKIIERLKIDKFVKSKKYIMAPIFIDSLCVKVAIRLVYLIHGNKESAYYDLLEEARQEEDLQEIEDIIADLEGNDEIARNRAMFELMYYYNTEQKGVIDKDKVPFSEAIDAEFMDELVQICYEFIDNAVENILAFEKQYGKIPLEECHFEGAYNEIITNSYCGFPTFLIDQTIWTFLCNEGDKWGVILLLIAYVLGLHSNDARYQKVERLGIVKMCGGMVKTIEISELSYKTFYAISKNYIGYKVSKEEKDWKNAFGTNEDRFNSIQQYYNQLFPSDTEKQVEDFRKYKQGTYEITYLQYWKFYHEYVNKYANMPTKPNYIKQIYLIKSKDYLIFIADSNSCLYLLNGGKFIKLEGYQLRYFENNLQLYGETIEKRFKKFWDTMDDIAEFCKKLDIDVHSGKVHGCIVDIDFFNHLYINPFDGTVTPYYASSTSSMEIHSNLYSLLSERLPGSIQKFNTLLEQQNKKLPEIICDRNIIPIEQKKTIPDMYYVSYIIKKFQSVHDANLITQWDASLIQKKAITGGKKK